MAGFPEKHSKPNPLLDGPKEPKPVKKAEKPAEAPKKEEKVTP